MQFPSAYIGVGLLILIFVDHILKHIVLFCLKFVQIRYFLVETPVKVDVQHFPELNDRFSVILEREIIEAEVKDLSRWQRYFFVSQLFLVVKCLKLQEEVHVINETNPLLIICVK